MVDSCVNGHDKHNNSVRRPTIRTKIKQDDLEELFIEEIKVKKQSVGAQNLYCNLCFSYRLRFALFLCYICDVYLCDACFEKHKHSCVSLESETTERHKKAECLLMGMRGEGMRQREFERNRTHIYGRVFMEHAFDKCLPRISGLCGLQNNRFAVLDADNFCMKILSSVSNTLKRYIRFGSEPRDATEIIIRIVYAAAESGPSSKFPISGATRDQAERQCLVAVTFPKLKQIWFVCVDKNPAVKTKAIHTEEKCLSIDFSDEKIFTLCNADKFRFSVYVFSTEGTQLKHIHNPELFADIRDLAVSRKGIYVTDLTHNTVLRLNVDDGKTTSRTTIEGSWPTVITVDPKSNVYLGSPGHRKVYKLSPDLRAFEILSIDRKYTVNPETICFSDEKLFIRNLRENGSLIVIQQT